VIGAGQSDRRARFADESGASAQVIVSREVRWGPSYQASAQRTAEHAPEPSHRSDRRGIYRQSRQVNVRSCPPKPDQAGSSCNRPPLVRLLAEGEGGWPHARLDGHQVTAARPDGDKIELTVAR